MKSLLTDPVVLICLGVLVTGIVAFWWAVRKFRSMPSSVEDTSPTDDLLPAAPDLGNLDFRAPDLNARASSVSTPAVSRDVADRLDSMTQRLTEMQTVLMKQSATSSSSGPSGAATGVVGQGFSPETIEKLLKIIGNVIQQVDILQKSLNPPNETSAPRV